ncbi:MAG TPA: hypothetical protein VFM32_05200 [Spongiibacteraceae bacterium]|nr:hypothetical protein [Spongiibacteraceae bacterium]
MLLTVLVSLVFALIIGGLITGAVVIRRRQNTLNAQREAAQLQRRADHLFKIALAAQVHTSHSAIARSLLDEAVRVLEYSTQLDPHAELTANLLRECLELIANIENEPSPQTSEVRTTTLDFPETELIEAQMHLTEAMRLLIGLEKRNQISYDALAEMTAELKHAQRAIDLRLKLSQASHALEGDRDAPKRDEASLANEYLAELERSRAHPSH